MRQLTVDLVLAKAKSKAASSIEAVTLASLLLSDIGVLAVFVNLRQVSLVDNCISRLGVFRYLPRLEALYLRKNLVSQLAEVGHLARCPRLTTLSLADNPIWQQGATRLDVLAIVTGLIRLDDTAVSSAEIVAARVRSDNHARQDQALGMLEQRELRPGRLQSGEQMGQPAEEKHLGRKMGWGAKNEHQIRIDDDDYAKDDERPKERIINLAGINVLKDAAIDETRLRTGHNWKPITMKSILQNKIENKWIRRPKPVIPLAAVTASKDALSFQPRQTPIEK